MTALQFHYKTAESFAVKIHQREVLEKEIRTLGLTLIRQISHLVKDKKTDPKIKLSLLLYRKSIRLGLGLLPREVHRIE